jgi:hypothetical protein
MESIYMNEMSRRFAFFGRLSVLLLFVLNGFLVASMAYAIGDKDSTVSSLRRATYEGSPADVERELLWKINEDESFFETIAFGMGMQDIQGKRKNLDTCRTLSTFIETSPGTSGFSVNSMPTSDHLPTPSASQPERELEKAYVDRGREALPGSGKAISSSDHLPTLSTLQPERELAKVYVGRGKATLSESGKVIYRLTNDRFEILDPATGQFTVTVLPPNFPRFSWAMDMAYDTKRQVVSVVTLGGEGFLYRFDTRQQRWIDYRSLNNVDIFSLSYDSEEDRYVARTDRGHLVFVSGEGAVLFTRNAVSRMQGFGRLYDRGNDRMPRVVLAAKGNDVALVYIKGNAVSRVWHYSIVTDDAVLTYARY